MLVAVWGWFRFTDPEAEAGVTFYLSDTSLIARDTVQFLVREKDVAPIDAGEASYQ